MKKIKRTTWWGEYRHKGDKIFLRTNTDRKWREVWLVPNPEGGFKVREKISYSNLKFSTLDTLF